MITYFVPGKPIPQGSKRWVGRMIEANDNLRPWRATITSYTLKAMHNSRWVLYDEPVMLTCMFYFQRPKGHYGTGRNAGLLKPSAPEWVTSTPDLDKLVRAVQDGITDAGLWKDDSQVVFINATKRYAEQAGVNIFVSTMREIEEEDRGNENDPMAGTLHDARLQLDI